MAVAFKWDVKAYLNYISIKFQEELITCSLHVILKDNDVFV